MKFLMAVAAVIAGIGVVIQSGMNAQLRASLGSGLVGAAVSFSVGLLALIAMLVLARIPVPTVAVISQVPIWAWYGGLFGAFCVAVIAICVRDLGAGYLLILITLGQVLGSIVVDHYGLLGMPVRSLSLVKVIACALLLIGVAMLAFQHNK